MTVLHQESREFVATLPRWEIAAGIDSCLQDALPAAPVTEVVSSAMQYFTRLWWASSPELPAVQMIYSRPEQLAAEQQMDHFLRSAEPVLRKPPLTPADQQVVQDRLLAIARQTACLTFRLQDEHLDALGVNDFAEIAMQFARQARQFDAQLSLADMYQAGRNVITTNMMQRLWGMPVVLNQAIFAYSMLYPYTDNYLDDPSLSRAQKLAFSQRFSSRLEGEDVSPANAHEGHIFDLVSLIEAEYDRSAYPQVFDSLLAIHRGQTRSLALLRPNAAPYDLDVLGISLEKGGTSTLADGYLAAGNLTPLQAQFAFGLGAFLQLSDDLEDVSADRKLSIQTLFSQTAAHWPLDTLTSRTLNFGLQVFGLLEPLGTPPALYQFVRQCAFQPFVTAIYQARKLHTRSYLGQVEQRSAFRFSHLENQGRWMHHRRKDLFVAFGKLLLSEQNIALA